MLIRSICESPGTLRDVRRSACNISVTLFLHRAVETIQQRKPHVHEVMTFFQRFFITAPGRVLLARRTTRFPQLKVKREEKKSLSDVKAKRALHSPSGLLTGNVTTPHVMQFLLEVFFATEVFLSCRDEFGGRLQANLSCRTGTQGMLRTIPPERITIMISTLDMPRKRVCTA